MKPFSFLIMLTISLCAGMCCTEPDEGPDFQVEKNNLITVENNENTFDLNDQITIETIIENNQITTTGENLLLTDLYYNDSLEDAFFQYSVTLYKQTGFGTLSAITVPIEDIATIEGFTETNGNFITSRSTYDVNSDSFKSSFTITLKEPGTFFLSDGRFGINDFRGITISGGVYELGFVEIKSSIQNANTNGGYEFVVNE